ALLDFEAGRLGLHWRLARKTSDDFVFARSDDIEVFVTMVPGDVEGPISIRTKSFLPDDLREELALRPPPDFLPSGGIDDLEIVSLAGIEIEWHQFVGGIDDGQHESRAAGNIGRLNIEGDGVFRWLCNVLHLPSGLLLRCLRLRKR